VGGVAHGGATRAVIIMRKLNLCGIPCDMNLRALQDIYSKLIDIAGVSDSDDGEIEVRLGWEGSLRLRMSYEKDYRKEKRHPYYP
jgi:hypothetical protein